MMEDEVRSKGGPVEGAMGPGAPPASGLARSIRRLFPDPPPDPAEDLPGDPSSRREEAVPPPTPKGIRDRFTTLVARYLRSSGEGRGVLATGILEEAQGLREAGEHRALADAAIACLLMAEEEGGEEAQELAERLLDARSCADIAARLGADRDLEVRASLTQAARRLPSLLAPALADALAEAQDRGARRALMDALVELGQPGRSAVLRLLRDPRWYAVRNRVSLLAEIGDSEAVEALTVPLANEDPRVRRETVMALAKVGGEDAGFLLLGMLGDGNPGVREAAAMGIGALHFERGQRPLLEQLASEEVEEVVAQLLRALGQLGDPGAVPAIEKYAVGSLFSRPSREIRIAAYRALAAIGTPHARSLVVTAASDRDPAVRSVVEGILRTVSWAPGREAPPEGRGSPASP